MSESKNTANGVHVCNDPHQSLDAVCGSIIEVHRKRRDYHQEEKSLTLRIRAICRRLCGGDKGEADKLYAAIAKDADYPDIELVLSTKQHCEGLFMCRQIVEQHRKQAEKEMVKLAKELPVYPWVENVKGFGALGFTSIIGETGNLSNYAGPAKVWKRLGLAVINGGRQRRVTGEEALEHGYSPSRRSVVWTIGDSLFRCGGEYSDLCRERKEVEREKAKFEGLIVCPSAKIPAKDKENYRSDGHVHNRAKRYMEKRLIRDLWRAWRDSSAVDDQGTLDDQDDNVIHRP